MMQEDKYKYSVIIPTMNHLEDCLKPCLESIIKNTDLDEMNVEVVVVANGCNDGTEDYVKSLGPRFKILSFSEPLGYTKAINAGIGVSEGEFVVLMNNDCQVLDYAKSGDWLRMLEAPFLVDNMVGITGPSKLFSKEINSHFLIFFLVMMRRGLFYELGYLDEVFNPGGGEDIDFCARTERAGYKLVKVPEDGTDWKYETGYPIYHKAEATVHSDVAGWEDMFKARMALLKNRYDRYSYSEFADVTCEISTKGRYGTTLPLAIMSVANQTLKPKYLIIFVDDNPGDLRERSLYKHLFMLLQSKGIEWSVLFGEGKGQVLNHQKVIDIAKTEWIWRLDDDNFAEPDVLKTLMANTGPNIGAVGGSVLDPGAKYNDNMMASTQLPYINVALNMQWIEGKGIMGTDHLYSTFVYRKEAAKHGYCMELSPVGHREETIFTYEMKRAGWQLLIDKSCTTWHMREASGGIRSYQNSAYWEQDEMVFKKKLDEWGIKLKHVSWINLDCGLGDHWVFRMALQDILDKHPNHIFMLAACYSHVFEDIEDKRIRVVSVADGISMLGKQRMDELNIYAHCIRKGWNKSLKEAFADLYNG